MQLSEEFYAVLSTRVVNMMYTVSNVDSSSDHFLKDNTASADNEMKANCKSVMSRYKFCLLHSQ